MSVLIVEDDIKYVRHLKALLGELLPSATVVSNTGSVKHTVEWLQAHKEPDLIFMDVDLPDGQCFDIFHHFPTFSPVIFTTNCGEHALKAFKYNSVDYLLKPITKEDVELAVEKWKSRPKLFLEPKRSPVVEEVIKLVMDDAYKSRFLVKQGQRLIPVKVADIAYFSSCRSLTYAHTRCHKKYHLEFALDELEIVLDPLQFNRVTRNFILAKNIISSVSRLSNRTLKLETEFPIAEEIIVSKEKSCQVKEWLGA